jgi:hypothetical protein
MADGNKERPPLMNGLPSADEQLAARDIKRIQERGPDPLIDGIASLVRRSDAREATQPPMIIADVAAPFSQREHELLLKSVDHVANDWVTQLQQVRHNSEALEQMVLQRASKLKADLTQLFLLGGAVVCEAKRGSDVNAKLTDEIEKLTEGHAA